MVRPTGGPANSGLGADILNRSSPFYQKLLTLPNRRIASSSLRPLRLRRFGLRLKQNLRQPQSVPDLNL